MDIKYKIVEVHEKDHSFVVRYYTDVITEEELATQKDENGKILRCRTDYSLTMWNPHATPEEIDNLIKMSAPAQWFSVLEHMKQNDSSLALDHIKTKLNTEHVFTHEPPATYKEDKNTITDAEIDSFIARLTAVV